MLAPVPNVPCGVERTSGMAPSTNGALGVPNVPCGVERVLSLSVSSIASSFLMYRVELKERNIKDFAKLNKLFLMYRVELKVA